MNETRTCIVCRAKGTKDNFIKFVFNKNNEIFIQEKKQIDGRGAYVCNSADCIKKCAKMRALSKAFKHNIPQEFYEEILNHFGISEN